MIVPCNWQESYYEDKKSKLISWCNLFNNFTSFEDACVVKVQKQNKVVVILMQDLYCSETEEKWNQASCSEQISKAECLVMFSETDRSMSACLPHLPGVGFMWVLMRMSQRRRHQLALCQRLYLSLHPNHPLPLRAGCYGINVTPFCLPWGFHKIPGTCCKKGNCSHCHADGQTNVSDGGCPLSFRTWMKLFLVCFK